MKMSEYNLAYNALNTLRELGNGDYDYYVDNDLRLSIITAKTSQDLAVVTKEIQDRIQVNKHGSKAKMVKFLASSGYRPLQESDVIEGPLQSYCYQKPSGYYATVYVVKDLNDD